MAKLDYDTLNRLVAECEPGAGGVFFFPWLMGERVPVDDAAGVGLLEAQQDLSGDRQRWIRRKARVAERRMRR